MVLRLDVPNTHDMLTAIGTYRSVDLLPKTRIVNGFDVPNPIKVLPEKGFLYYLADPTCSALSYSCIWSGNELAERYFNRGLCFTTEEAAVANAKAMLGIDPYPSKKEV